MLLSILIPSIPERADKLAALLANLQPQIKASNGEAEVLVLTDLRTMELGEKRNRLMQIAAGKFVIHLDDDDALVDDAVETLLQILDDPKTDDDQVDVIAYESESKIDDKPPFKVKTSIKYENEQVYCTKGIWGDIRRKPWHWCCWRTEMAKRHKFIGRIDEDWQWLSQVLPHVRAQFQLQQVIHIYRFNQHDSFCQEKPR